MTNQKESSPLKYHWSNPIFDGLPWPAGKERKRSRLRPCVKKTYTDEQEVAAEVELLRREVPQCKWWYQACHVCEGWHVCRKGSSYVHEGKP